MPIKRNLPSQPTLLDVPKSDERPTPVSKKITYNGIHVNQATFKAGLAARVHRWFRLTPSFGPDLVREMLGALGCEADGVVLDPFAGASTTLIECQLEGVRCVGFEINPFLYFVGETCLNWSLDTTSLQALLGRIEKQFAALASQTDFGSLESQGLRLPPIHNPTRWWRPDVLTHLVLLKSCIDNSTSTTAERNFFRLALAGVLVPDLTNVELGKLQLHFIERVHDEIQVLDTFAAHARMMINDLSELQAVRPHATSRLFNQDSTNLSDFNLDYRVNCVITSPPYPNRYSYIWNTRPHLYMLDFLSTAKEASDIDKKTIGGTWGTATSMLAKGEVQASFPAVARVVGEVASRIRQADNLMANYAMKYFNLLAKQIVEMDRLLAPDARVAYVVGCSRLKGVYVETDLLLGDIMEGLGLNYKVDRIERIRRRNSGKDLHESIVYARKM